jgi:hypothetical protein
MDFIKAELLNFFNNYSKDVISIIYEYCTITMKSSVNDYKLTLDNHNIIIVRELTNNRIAIGYSDTNICILNLLDGSKIFRFESVKGIKNYYELTSSNIYDICQTNDDTIVCVTIDSIIWNFKNNTQKHMCFSGFHSVTYLKNNIIGCITKRNLYLHNTQRYEDLSNKNIDCKNEAYFIISNNKFIIARSSKSYSNIKNNIAFRQNKNIMKYYKKIHGAFNIIEIFDIDEYLSKNYNAVNKKYIAVPYHSTLSINNISTHKSKYKHEIKKIMVHGNILIILQIVKIIFEREIEDIISFIILTSSGA